MELSGRRVVDASPPQVWALAFRADVLESCLPGAELVERTTEGFECRFDRSIASIRTEMALRIDIDRDDRPDSVACTLHGTDERTASTIDGTIRITATPTDDEQTALSYEATLTATGRLSSLGPRLLERQLTSDLRTFLDALSEEADRPNATEP